MSIKNMVRDALFSVVREIAIRNWKKCAVTEQIIDCEIEDGDVVVELTILKKYKRLYLAISRFDK